MANNVKRVAIVLSGCGVFDGAEIHESVLTMLFLAKSGVLFQCFAPDMAQLHVVNHLSGEVAEGESRNVLVESARIARGDIQPLTSLDANEFDALVLPGGFGAAKNLCDFALKGADAKVHSDVLTVCQAFASAKKPAAYACIAPALLAEVYGTGVKLTIGKDEDTALVLGRMGADHVACEVNQVVVDEANKVVTTPAYMLAANIAEASDSIEAMVAALLTL